MADPVKIAIVIEEGMVVAVLSAGVPVEYVTVDYDVGDASPEMLRDVPQDGGGTAPAFVEALNAKANGPWVLEMFELASDADRYPDVFGSDRDNRDAFGSPSMETEPPAMETEDGR